MIVQFLNFDLPWNSIAFGVVLKCDWEIAPLVELAELCWATMTDFIGAWRVLSGLCLNFNYLQKSPTETQAVSITAI